MAILGDPRQQSEQEEAGPARPPLCPTAASNDPWRTEEGDDTADEDATSGESNSFSDSFKPPIERLPDSDEYLAALEAKLVRVQKKGSLVRDLQRKREDEMRRFVDCQDDAVRSEESDWVDRQDLASGTTENPLIRRISPDRQVSTVLISFGSCMRMSIMAFH